jgi:hypothetical protein
MYGRQLRPDIFLGITYPKFQGILLRHERYVKDGNFTLYVRDRVPGQTVRHLVSMMMDAGRSHIYIFQS